MFIKWATKFGQVHNFYFVWRIRLKIEEYLYIYILHRHYYCNNAEFNIYCNGIKYQTRHYTIFNFYDNPLQELNFIVSNIHKFIMDTVVDNIAILYIIIKGFI